VITIKEEFLTDAKTKRAIRLGGSVAIHMWLAMKAYAAAKLTDGFVPDVLIDDLPGAPKNPRKALRALVECRAPKHDGTMGSGLVDEAPNGWQLHDYLDHANSAQEELQRREKERTRKAAYRATKTGHVPRDNGGTQGGTGNGTDGGTTHGTESGVPRDLARAPDTRPRAPAPPAQPSPAQPTPGDPTSQPGSDQTASPDPRLAGRFVDRGSDEDGSPKPRHDPNFEKLTFARWFPSQRILDWAHAIGLSDQAYDDAIIAVRNKIRGPGDVGFWDKHVRSFLAAEAKRSGSAPSETKPESPEVTKRRLEAQAKLEARRAESERLGREAREKAIAEGRPDPVSGIRAFVESAAADGGNDVPGAA
jgi:hypothetical protein